jgi:hypothetical protein
MKVWKVHISFGKTNDKLTEMITIDLNSLHAPKGKQEGCAIYKPGHKRL